MPLPNKISRALVLFQKTKNWRSAIQINEQNQDYQETVQRKESPVQVNGAYSLVAANLSHGNSLNHSFKMSL